MTAKIDHLPPELIPVLDLIAEMVADAMIKDTENENGNRDDAPRRAGADYKNHEGAA